ncbi:hypothetical protein ONZ45_g4866 [Pleurotus djamor]|nr:hypothetical protein ONZ45_g4866 [Pleurotus djamor]
MLTAQLLKPVATLSLMGPPEVPKPHHPPLSKASATSSQEGDSQNTGNTSLTQPATQPPPLFSEEEKSQLWGSLVPFGAKHPRIDLHRSFRKYEIGRYKRLREAFQICLEGDKISHHHCSLEWNGKDGLEATVKVRDKSRNGTYIKRDKVGRDKSEYLRDGMSISFGTDPSGIFPGSSDSHFYEFKFIAYEAPLSGLLRVYSLANEIGSGAFATVKQCLHRDTGRTYAVKMIKNKRPSIGPASQGNSFMSYQKFTGTSEFNIMQRLKHPNICELVEFFIESNGDINLVLEYVDGGDMLKYMERIGRTLTNGEAQHLTYQICAGVAYIHAQGVAHRDLKPENILITRDTPPIVKIADFGLAKMLVDETELRTRCGTKPFCAPEVLYGGGDQTYSRKADSWSVGNIVYWMFVGQGAYNPDTWYSTSVGNGVIREPHINWSNLHNTDAEPQGIEFIQQLLIFDPSKRMSLSKALNHIWIAHEVSEGLMPRDYPQAVTQASKVRITNLCFSPPKEYFEIPGLIHHTSELDEGTTTPTLVTPPASQPRSQPQTPRAPETLPLEPIDEEESLGSNFSDMSIKDKDKPPADQTQDEGTDTDTGSDQPEGLHAPDSQNTRALKRGHSQVSSSSSVGGGQSQSQANPIPGLTTPVLTPTPTPTPLNAQGNANTNINPAPQERKRRPLASRKKPRFDPHPPP